MNWLAPIGTSYLPISGANFTTSVNGCAYRLTLDYGGSPSNIQYEFYFDGTLIDTVASASSTYDWEAGALFPNEDIRIVQTITDGGAIVTERTETMPAFAGCYMPFQSSRGAAENFTPLVEASPSAAVWRFPDDEITYSEEPNILGSDAGFDGTSKTVYFRVTDWADWDWFRVESDNLEGIIDLSEGIALTWIDIAGNSGVTGLVIGNLTVSLYEIDVQNCDITGTLDLSPAGAFLASRIFVGGNSGLTAITNPTSSSVISRYRADNTGITTLDISTLTGLAEMIVNNCGSLTSITNGLNSSSFSSYWAYSCNLTGTLEAVDLTGWGGDIRLNNNPLLTDISTPASSNPTSIMYLHSCDLGWVDIRSMTFASDVDFDMRNNAMTTAQVNRMLHDLDSTLPATGTGTIDISGTNGPPNNFTGGYDGNAAASSLSGKGYTVITS